MEDGSLNPENLADRFCRGHIFGIGGTVREFIRNRQAGRPWYECGPKSTGNGALMRIAPILIPHLRSPSAELWTDTLLASMLTHNDAGSTAAGLAFVNILWRLLDMQVPPDPAWWLETYVEVAKELEGDTGYRPRSPHFDTYEGPSWRFVEKEVQRAYDADVSIL